MLVFVSSTFKDLVDHRRAVADALERLGLQLERMETFGARPQEATQACLTEIEASELFVGIYAHRYGYVPTNSAVSITEAEFDHAFSNRRPTFCFFVDEAYPWPEDFVENEPGRSLLRRFKTRVERLVVRDVFTTADVLASRIAPQSVAISSQIHGDMALPVLHSSRDSPWRTWRQWLLSM
jgi:Domain of unknown function (DUF4062)